MDPDLRYAQVQKRREGGRVVEVKRQILFGSEGDLIRIMEADGCGSRINTAYVERDNLTSRQSNGRLVRKTLSHSKRKDYLQFHIDFEDAIYNFVRPHSGLRLRLRRPRTSWSPLDCSDPGHGGGVDRSYLEPGRASELVSTTARLKSPFTAYGYSTQIRPIVITCCHRRGFRMVRRACSHASGP